MNVLLQTHKAKHVCDVPEGLRELCADISREVIRFQPYDIYDFIGNYLDSLMITRENTQIAMKVVQNVVLKSEHIVDILCSTDLKLKEIAAAAPRLQKAFRAYLDALDTQRKECGCDADSDIYVDNESEHSICRILKETGATYSEAERAATKIQALFRGHYERMSLADKRGEVQWQRAAATTVDILRRTGVTYAEAVHAAKIIQSVYRGYYTRKSMNMRKKRPTLEKIDFDAWLKMMNDNTGLTLSKANIAATVIQKSYRSYRKRIAQPTPSVSFVTANDMSLKLKAKSKSSKTSLRLPSEAVSVRTESTEDAVDDLESTGKASGSHHTKGHSITDYAESQADLEDEAASVVKGDANDETDLELLVKGENEPAD